MIYESPPRILKKSGCLVCTTDIIIIPDDFFSDEMRITEVQTKHSGNFFKPSHAVILLF